VTAVGLAVYAGLLAGASVLVWRRPVAAFYLWAVGLAFHNAVMAALYGGGIRGSVLTFVQAWKEILLVVAFARVAFDAARARRLPFRPTWVDALAVAYGGLVCLYAVLPQSSLGGSADRHAVGLALKHDLVPVAAFLLARCLRVDRRELVRLCWTVVGVAAAVAVLGLLDDYLVPIGWWRSSAVVDYFHKQLGYDYNGTGGLPENFVYNTGGDTSGFLRRLVSVFLSPLASAYLMVVALLLAAALRGRTRIVIALGALASAALLFTFSRSSLIALAAGFVVLAAVTRRWWPVAAAVVTLAVSVAWVHVFPSIAPTGHWTKQDLVEQRQNARVEPGNPNSPLSTSEPSIHSHLTSLRDGAHTVLHHPQGFGLGNAGQTASRTETPLKAGESNYTEIGVETGLLGALVWIAWNVGILVGLVRVAPPVAAAFGAALVLAIQTDVIGDPWMGYVLWGLAGLSLAPVALADDGDPPRRRHRARPPEGGRRRPLARVLP
jgi:O-Antigen ligase